MSILHVHATNQLSYTWKSTQCNCIAIPTCISTRAAQFKTRQTTYRLKVNTST